MKRRYRVMSWLSAVVILSGIVIVSMSWSQSSYGTVAVARIQACTFTHTVRAIDSLVLLPTAIREALGAISDKGGPFNSTDVVIPGQPPFRRFIRAGQVGELYFIWYEQGGRGYSPYIALYHMRPGDPTAEQVAQRADFLDPCQFTVDLLSGKTPTR
jgi:hypothetical protein